MNRKRGSIIGTRSTVKFYDGEDCICAIYQQYDGYLSGVGKELAEFLESKTMVNGFTKSYSIQANGIGCLSAQYVAEKKDGVGNLYMTTSHDTQEYNYVVRLSGDKGLIIKAFEERHCIFQGKPLDFIKLIGEEDV